MRVKGIKGFTLIELLIVIVILGVMVAVVGQNMSVGTDMTRLRTATRGLLQTVRYCRTMALLHQEPVELTIGAAGTLDVKGKGQANSDGFVASSAFAAEAINTSAPDADGHIPGEDEKENEENPETPETTEMTADSENTRSNETSNSSNNMTDLDLSKKYERISFVFDGYTDSFDDNSTFGRQLRNKIHNDIHGRSEEPGNEDENATNAIRFNSNGTCRPFRIKVTTDPDNPDADSLTVVVDRLGSAKVEEDEEEKE